LLDQRKFRRSTGKRSREFRAEFRFDSGAFHGEANDAAGWDGGRRCSHPTRLACRIPGTKNPAAVTEPGAIQRIAFHQYRQ
jgi:hypothetical protein